MIEKLSKVKGITMKYSLEKVSKKVVEKRLSVVVDGVEVGKVEKCTRSCGVRWHACLDVSGSDLLSSLAQGHGDTAEGAIENAFSESRRSATQYLSSLDALRTKVFGV